MSESTEPILSVRGLHVEVQHQDGARPIVRGVDLDLFRGRTLALVGESASGKTLTALALVGLVEPPVHVSAGCVWFRGEDLLRAPAERLQRARGNGIAMVFQEPIASLNPVLTVGAQIAESLRVSLSLTRAAAHLRTRELLTEAGVPEPDELARAYPHELSGGLGQRVMIAMALASDPEVLIADEPTSALDTLIETQILTLIRRLQRDHRLAVLFITHDLSLVEAMKSDVAVMHAGRIVERSHRALGREEP